MGQEWKITVAQQMGNSLVNLLNFILFSNISGPTNIMTSHSSYLPPDQGNPCDGKFFSGKNGRIGLLMVYMPEVCSYRTPKWHNHKKKGKISASESKAFQCISK